MLQRKRVLQFFYAFEIKEGTEERLREGGVQITG